MAEKFATAVNCMDGRVQKPVIEYLQKSFGVDYVDMVTEPGPNKILAEGKDINIIEKEIAEAVQAYRRSNTKI